MRNARDIEELKTEVVKQAVSFSIIQKRGQARVGLYESLASDTVNL